MLDAHTALAVSRARIAEGERRARQFALPGAAAVLQPWQPFRRRGVRPLAQAVVIRHGETTAAAPASLAEAA